MKNFDQMKQQWATRPVPPQPEKGPQLVVKQVKKIRKKQLIMQLVLGVTVLVLLVFFFYVAAYRHSPAFMGLGIMIACILIRMGLELGSMLKQQILPIDQDLLSYNARLRTYYKKRKYIHLLLTPMLFVGYIIGFILLLPSFKVSLSSGFYTYILISSLVVFAGLAWLIIAQIKQELRILKSLEQMED